MLKLLINCGQLDLFERNASGQSPLVFAARMSHPGLECVSILVASIDAIRKRRRDDSLSDHFSDIGKNRKDLLKLLPLYDEADIKYALTDSIGRNVLHYAALYNAPHLVNYFATCGANVNLIDNNGDAPIHLAAKGGNVEALLALLNNNCDVNIKDALDSLDVADRTAYSIANNQGHSVICDLFHSIASTSCV
ncbi:ankyrin repeat protein [Dictyocaulus viviparus]|uniref:Ankyrin repeat protein n=1 Tax=Dictyocaulus viviparus TaxID=29172 RepID=A0A0D8Y4H5_DICVI|nr:ankyrin repeat protein [Dictyocaulus viviparus]